MDTHPTHRGRGTYLVRFEGNWYVGSWDPEARTVVLQKSRRMPGEELRTQIRWPGDSEGTMGRVVPQGSVELVGTLKYRGIPVYVEGLDAARSTLRLKLTRSNGWAYGEPQRDLSALGRDGWVIQDSKDQVWFSPFIDVDDPRLEKVIGELR